MGTAQPIVFKRVETDPIKLDRRADIELSHGRATIAEALSIRAAELRAAAPAVREAEH